MMKLASTRIQSRRTLPESQPKFHFKHFSEKPRNLVRANPSSSSVVVRSLVISSEFKLLDTAKIKDAEEEKRNENLSHSRDFQQRKPRCLCLHGFRTNGDILKKQIQKWPKSVHNKIDFVFVDAPFPAEGKSDVQGIYDPPFYEWFQFSEDYYGGDKFNVKCIYKFFNSIQCFIDYGGKKFLNRFMHWTSVRN